jgi:hypothetical protein
MSDKMPWQRLGALWTTKSGSKKCPLTGRLGDAQIAVVKNEHKEEGSKQPDYRLMLIPYEPEATDADDGKSADEDDIPF